MPRRLLPSLFTLLALVAGCGGGQVERTVTPFTEAHERVFQNGIDLVEDPEDLGGAWREAWDDDIDARITEADLVLLVRVETIRHDTDLDRRDTYRLIVRVEQRYLGEVEDELTLVTREGDAGFETVESNDERFLDQQFLAFIKWQRNDVDEIIPRWHLAPATDAVATRMRELLELRRDIRQHDPNRRRVIVHRN